MLGLVVVLVLPQLVSGPTAVSPAPVTTEPAAAPPPAADPQAARHDAEQSLQAYLQLRARLELDNAARWGEPEWSQAAQAATAGDRLFGQRQFGMAAESYGVALQGLQVLDAGRGQRLATALESGRQALDADNGPLAVQHFETALAIVGRPPSILDQIILNKAIVLENIYYDLDKWDIRPDAAIELDKLVTVLQDNPEIRIELSSHTDSRASADYNDELSKKRAQSAVDYIESKGIGADRLIARGYGESELIISDEQIDQLPTEEAKEAAHQRNRRTEFKVIEYNKVAQAEDEEVQEEELQQLEAQEIIESGGGDDLENKIDWDN